MDKFHYFGQLRGSRLRQNVQGNAIVPTAQMRSGDLSAYRPLLPGQVLGPTPIIYNPFDYDPATGLEAAISRQSDPVQSSRSVNSKASDLHGVAEHRPSMAFLSTQACRTQSSTRISEGIRLDWEKSARRLYGRYTWGERDAFNGGLVSELQGEKTPSSTHSTVIHWNQVLSPTMINDFSVSYSRVKWGIGRPLDVPDVSKEMGSVNTSDLNGGPD